MKAILVFGLFLVSYTSADLTTSIDLFSTELFQICRSTSFDTILSPFSIHDCLTMAALGATSETYYEFLWALRLSGTRNSIAADYRRLLTPYNAQTSEIKVSNGIYVQQEFKIQTAYKRSLLNNFYTKVKSIDFAQKQLAAATINADVAAATNQLIKDIVSPDLISDQTCLVLVNSVYFRSNWSNPFPKQDTEDRPFYTGNGASGNIRTMRQTAIIKSGYIARLDATLISLPYVNENFSFNVLLPKSITGLSALVRKVQGIRLGALGRGLRSTFTQLDLPSFKTESSFKLIEPLKELGIEKAFTPKADFGRMVENVTDLSISSVAHKAFITVDEDGTEAAAATVITIGTTSVEVRPQPLVIKVNRPFLYYISDCNMNVIFIGQFYGKAAA